MAQRLLAVITTPATRDPIHRTGPVRNVNDAFNAYASPSVKLDMTAVDLAAIDVLGYHLHSDEQVDLVSERRRQLVGIGKLDQLRRAQRQRHPGRI